MVRIGRSSFLKYSCLNLFLFWMSLSCAPKRETSSEQAVEFVSSHYADRKYSVIRISLKGDDLHYVKCENVPNFNCLDSKNNSSPNVETGFKKLAQVDNFVATHYSCLIKEYRSNIEAIKNKLRENRNYVVATYSGNLVQNIVFAINNWKNELTELELKLMKMLYYPVPTKAETFAGKKMLAD